jgi:predicted glycogen debranching enzyme
MSMLVQTPAPGDRQVKFVGDGVRFTLRFADGRSLPPGWTARLRTTLGRASRLREETIAAVETRRTPAGAAWHDVPLTPRGDHWAVEIPLAEVGWFQAKTYALDERGWQHWPEGPNAGFNVQPAWCRTGNTIYCAWPRLFGPAKRASLVPPVPLEALDRAGYAVIPPSGRLRDLRKELPHIFQTLGCRILHLLPVNPTPTTYARFGRFGSPYACGDLLAIDPALIEFDQRTTGVEQFQELAFDVHARGGRLFLDIVINHTGWGSTLQERHPEWFARESDGRFRSPGAWGNVWRDLVELEHHHAEVRRVIADALLEWCRRGVDGFRCDAGYKVPRAVWQYVIARVQQEFPETVFLLEGLGGGWEDTEALLTEGGMQWAYSELFQNYDGLQVSGYLDHALRQSRRVGVLVHYSETHDNPRLAAQGRAWSLLRNRLCALTSVSGGFGFTCGVEWLATEKVNVHDSPPLNWGARENLLPELARLNHLLASHPCFFDGARLTRLSPPGAPVYALLREAANGEDAVLVLANTDTQNAQPVTIDPARLNDRGQILLTALDQGTGVDLLEGPLPETSESGGRLRTWLAAAAVHCVAPRAEPAGLAGDAYRERKALEALAVETLAAHLCPEAIGAVPAARLAVLLERDCAGYLSAATYVPAVSADSDLVAELERQMGAYRRVVTWRLADQRRVTPVPPDHWLLVEDDAPFRATLRTDAAPHPCHRRSVMVAGRHVACFPPAAAPGPARLELERYGAGEPHVRAGLRYLAANALAAPAPGFSESGVALLTNGRGGMARMAVNLGAVYSKYDCVLGANLHPELPVDRHVFVKRARVWANADGLLSALDAGNLTAFTPGPPACWRFLASGGDGRFAGVELRAWMVPGENTTVLQFHRPAVAPQSGRELPAEADVRLTLRLDLEDRNFHHETQRTPGADHHFQSHCHPLPAAATARTSAAGGPRAPRFCGFQFKPDRHRRLRVWADAGEYHPQPEWSENILHPVEAGRGQVPVGAAWSPGWFELPLPPGAVVTVRVTAEAAESAATVVTAPTNPEAGSVAERLRQAARDFVVRRGGARTVIAGYPWFLDWGRDTLIAARGLLRAGFEDEVRQVLRAFGRFEERGTLPNTIHGDNASNRDTSDAPLWYGIVCEEFAAACPAADVFAMTVGPGARTVREVLESIAAHYLAGTPNGIRVDRESALVWSPGHFTWMDTNHPAGTPREGYPVEIQALWIRLLRLLDRLGSKPAGESWRDLAERAWRSCEELFWLAARGWYADVLRAAVGTSARAARADDALRSNCLVPIALGLARGARARRCVEAARQHLVIPGGLRSLAPLRVRLPLPIRAADGRLLNDPFAPYWGRYEGDEDARRKPAYHNGTAWVWTLPTFCEALARAWDFSPAAVAAATAYLGSVGPLLPEGCVGHLPEILDGDAPHAQRGCDAQAWSVTEVLRVAMVLAREGASAR